MEVKESFIDDLGLCVIVSYSCCSNWTIEKVGISSLSDFVGFCILLAGIYCSRECVVHKLRTRQRNYHIHVSLKGL